MLVEGQTVEMKWSNANKKWYRSKGYTYTKNGDYFTVDAKDISKGMLIKLKFKCDECGKEHKKYWKSHFDYLTKKEKPDLCVECNKKKHRNKIDHIVRSKRIKESGFDKRKVLNKVLNREKQGYECCYPIQERTVWNEDERKWTNYYFVKMDLKDKEKHYKSIN